MVHVSFFDILLLLFSGVFFLVFFCNFLSGVAPYSKGSFFSIGKSMSKGGLFWDIYILYLTINVTFVGLVYTLCEFNPCRIT